jgi:putative membrane protein
MRLIIRALVLVLGAVILALVGPTAVAQASTSQDGHGVTSQDRAFLRAAHQANLAEISTGRLAENKGRSAQVRDLGRMFVTDHTRLDSDLKQVARRLNVSLPNQPNATQRALAARLKKLSGTAFDKAFLDGQLNGHVMARSAGRTELAKGSNADAKTVARTSAPVVQHHINELVAAQRNGRG